MRETTGSPDQTGNLPIKVEFLAKTENYPTVNKHFGSRVSPKSILNAKFEKTHCFQKITTSDQNAQNRRNLTKSQNFNRVVHAIAGPNPTQYTKSAPNG